MTQTTLISHIIKILYYFRSKRKKHCELNRAEIKLEFHHNHPMNAASVLRHRDVGAEVKEKLKELYQEGLSPSAALDMIKFDLQVEHGDKYIDVCGDRKYCPTLADCFT